MGDGIEAGLNFMDKRHSPRFPPCFTGETTYQYTLLRGRPIFETRLTAFPRPKRLLGLLPARKVIGLKSLGAELFWI
jgi:hypothetical protein